MQPIRMLKEYGGDGNPVITQEFRPQTGGPRWVRAGWSKRASHNYLRTLARQGVTHVQVAFDDGARLADFTVQELLRSPR